MNSKSKRSRLIKEWDDGDLGEMHVAASMSLHSGQFSVSIDPKHAVELIEQLQAMRNALQIVIDACRQELATGSAVGSAQTLARKILALCGETVE